MIFQFKKLFISLIFTVALCCGLSVSASAANFYYGSVMAKDLPEEDLERYPYRIVYLSTLSSTPYLVFSSEPFEIEQAPGKHSVGVTIPVVFDSVSYSLIDGDWTNRDDSIDASAYSFFVYLGDFESLWINHDVRMPDTGAVLFARQDPIPASSAVNLTGSLSRTKLSTSYNYNGTSNYYLSYGSNTVDNLIPVSPGSRVTVTGRIVNAYYDCTKFSLWCLNASGVDKVSNRQPLTDDDCSVLPFVQLGTPVTIPFGTVCVWVEFHKSDFVFSLSDANFIIFGTYPDSGSSGDGSDPVLISRTYSFTDTTVITEVTLTGLDPSKVYEVYWAIYDTQDNLLGHGVSDQIGEITGVETATAFSRIVNLQPGTTYSLYWHLAENESVLDTTFSNTVTTLGLAPGGSETPGGSGGTGSDFVGEEDDISGSQGDGNTGILMQILNKLSAISDFLIGDKEVEDTPEQAIKDSTSDVTQAVADTIFGENSAIKPTVDTVTDVASIGSSVKSFFTTGVSVGDFFDLFNDSSLTSWFSEETAADLNSVPSVATFGIDDAMTESERIYFEKRARLYAFAGIGGVD